MRAYVNQKRIACAIHLAMSCAPFEKTTRHIFNTASASRKKMRRGSALSKTDEPMDELQLVGDECSPCPCPCPVHVDIHASVCV